MTYQLPNSDQKTDRNFPLFVAILLTALGFFLMGIFIPGRTNLSLLGLAVAISTVMAFIDFKKTMFDSVNKLPKSIQNPLKFLLSISFFLIHVVAGYLLSTAIVGLGITLSVVGLGTVFTLMSLKIAAYAHKQYKA